MIKGVIFDLDGTLIQLPIDYQKIQKSLKEFFNVSNDLIPLIPKIIELSKNDQNKIKTSFDLICREEISVSNNFKIMNGTLEILKFYKSKNVSLSLVTMQCKDALKKILEEMEISDLFDSLISRNESFDRQKQIKLSLKNINLQASEVLVVGDRINDIESAKKVGCTPILKINEIKKIPPFECKIIKNLLELKLII